MYYIPAHRNFLDKKPVSEWLRLRESNKGISLDYKKWHNEDGNKTVSCDEFETKIETPSATPIPTFLNATPNAVPIPAPISTNEIFSFVFFFII